jgi:hypothetical protein
MYFPEGYFSSQADKLFWERKVTLIFFDMKIILRSLSLISLRVSRFFLDLGILDLILVVGLVPIIF